MLKNEKPPEEKEPVLKPKKESRPKKEPTEGLFVCKVCGEIRSVPSSSYPGLCVDCGLKQGTKDARKPYENLKEKTVGIFALDFHEIPSSYGKETMIDLDQDMDGNDGAIVDNMILKIGEDYVEVRYRDAMGIGDLTSIVLTNHGSQVPEKKGAFWCWPKETESRECPR